jgi:DNA mismatch repair protein MutL
LPKIVKLEQHVADLIAAGEVVQRPASVVKELIENSIDAGAGIITVEITSGGMSYIRITDNGSGIAPQDVKTAFLRHATSKLRDAEGLEAIGTLGFRGEALAAISAVSRIELQTRQQGADEGVRLILEAGKVVSMAPVGCPEGTTIVVRDLFFNTPARFKFMKTDRAEGSGVASIVLRCTLSRPDVSIHFIKDGKTEYHTPGDSRVESCIYTLFGKEFFDGLLSAESEDETVSVKGYVSKTASSRGNRGYQFFFVNGRSIRSLTLQSAIEQAYKNTLPSGRFPSCVLYITTSLGSVDVNVHPSKTEIKFASDKQVFDGVYYAALGALERTNFNEEFRALNTEKSGGFTSMPVEEYRKAHTFKNNRNYVTPQVNEPQRVYNPNLFSSNNAKNDNLSSSQLPNESFRLIGEALNLFIIVEHHNSVWFIDKHAAHERIHFDALKNGGYEAMSESLITPVICRFGPEDVFTLLEASAFLDKLGFTVESFGEDAIAVRHIPADIDIGDTESVLSEMCPDLQHSGTAEPKKRDNLYKTIACKAAIKAGRSSSIRELESLAERVLSGEVSTCPHGRPVAFELTKSALDKRFGKA